MTATKESIIEGFFKIVDAQVELNEHLKGASFEVQEAAADEVFDLLENEVDEARFFFGLRVIGMTDEQIETLSATRSTRQMFNRLLNGTES